MAVNHVEYGDELLIDLRSDTVTEDVLPVGYTAHNRAGDLITGRNTFDADTSDGDATSSDIVLGVTAYSAGNRITGGLSAYVYVAIIDQTSISNIVSAYNSNRSVIAVSSSGSNLSYLGYINTSTPKAVFISFGETMGKTEIRTVTSSGWSYTGALELSTTISSSSTNNQYPTAKAVYDLFSTAGTGTNINIDNEMSSTSTNPVMNKIIKAYADTKLSANGGEMSGNIDMNGNAIQDLWYINFSNNALIGYTGQYLRVCNYEEEPVIISGIDTPTENYHAANKLYVDNAISNIPSATLDSSMSDSSVNAVQNKIIKAYADTKLPKSGGTMTGNLNMNNNHINNVGWIMINDVFIESESYGNISISGEDGEAVRISGIATPTNANDAVNKSYVDNLTPSGGGTNSYYGVCSTAASTQAKTVTCTGFSSLTSGTIVTVKFSNYNTASEPTLNVNNTGAKGIVMYGQQTPFAYMWRANEVVQMVYDGTYWVMIKGFVASTDYYGVVKLSNTIDTSVNYAATPNAVKSYVDSHSGGTVDSTMSSSSTNPVQNNVIKTYVDGSITSAIYDSWEGTY